MKRFRITNGYTLVEMLVAMTIFATLLTVSYGAAISATRLYQKETAIRELQNDARNIVEFMTTDAGQPTLENLTVDGNTVTLRFKNDKVHTYSYDAANQNINFINEINQTQPLNVSTDKVMTNFRLIPTSADNDSFMISMTLDRVLGGKHFNFTFETAIAREDLKK